jgi:hypothetical protein
LQSTEQEAARRCASRDAPHPLLLERTHDAPIHASCLNQATGVRENNFAPKTMNYTRLFPYILPGMRGAEFSSSAKRSKSNRSSRARVRTVRLSHSGDIAPVSALVPQPSDASVADASVADAMITDATTANAAALESVTKVTTNEMSVIKKPGPESPHAEAPPTRERALGALIRRVGSSPLASAAPIAPLGAAARPSELAASLSDHVVFNDEKLARKYASEPIPI